MNTEKDIYDLEVERLTANPELIFKSWEDAEPLFRFAQIQPDGLEKNCGCLTTTRNNVHDSVRIHPDVNDLLTQEIKLDARIPRTAKGITYVHLPVFAEWQRKLDVYREKYKTVTP